MDTYNNPENPTEAMTVPQPDDSRRPVRVAYLVIGSFFLGIVALATSLDTGAIPWSGARYLGPALLVVVGVIGLLATLATSNRRRAVRKLTD